MGYSKITPSFKLKVGDRIVQHPIKEGYKYLTVYTGMNNLKWFARHGIKYGYRVTKLKDANSIIP